MLDKICAAVRAAGEIVLSAETYCGDGIQKSGDGNYVTEYDVRVQNCLRGALASICPGAAFCGEENGEPVSYTHLIKKSMRGGNDIERRALWEYNIFCRRAK